MSIDETEVLIFSTIIGFALGVIFITWMENSGRFDPEYNLEKRKRAYAWRQRKPT